MIVTLKKIEALSDDVTPHGNARFSFGLLRLWGLARTLLPIGRWG